MIIYVDIDETICYYEKDRDQMKYEEAIPNYENIAKVNKLYNDGHQITFWTARGTQTGINWYDVTKQQLLTWGVLHHNLLMGKPYFDLFIDDKALNVQDW